MTCFDIIETDWGPFVAVATARGLAATFLPERRGEPVEHRVLRRWPDARLRRHAVPGLRRAVTAFFAGRRVVFDVTCDLSDMTEFKQMVLEAARRIPYGSTASYSDLARAAGRPQASRAVGSVMASNPLPLVVPCHRVVRADGTIGGFSSPEGVAMKRRLLALEGVRDVPRLV